MTALTASARYNKLAADREPYLARARAAAALTIPSLMPPEGATGATDLPTPFQALGAQGVNTIAAKTTLALFPANDPFFRLEVAANVKQELTLGDSQADGQVQQGLAVIENEANRAVNEAGTSTAMFYAMKLGVVTGNALIQIQPNNTSKVYRLDSYVVKRTPDGLVREIVVKEKVLLSDLPMIVREKIADPNGDKEVTLYTWLRRVGADYIIHQEMDKGDLIPGTMGTYPADKCPWIALRWNAVHCEDYGRGHVEEYIGDLSSLDALTQAIVEGSAAVAKVLFFVKPEGTTDEDDVAEAENGDVLSGNADDVTVVQANKVGDFQTALSTIQGLEKRLSTAFLITGVAVQRDAERVTAEEIRTVAKELDDTLGGIYSTLSQDLQLPYVRRMLHQLQKQGRIPTLPKAIQPAIITGLAALGRGTDLTRLTTWASIMKDTFGPEAFAQRANLDEFGQIVGASLGIKTSKLMKSADQLAAEQAQEQKQQLIQAAVPHVMSAAQSQQPQQ